MFPAQASAFFTKNRGFVFAALAAILFGASTPASKVLLPGSDPWLIAGLLYLGSGCGLFLLSAFFRFFGVEFSSDSKLTMRDLPWIFGATFFGGVCGPVFLMMGLAQTEASTASLLLNIEGVLTALLAWFVFKENFDRRIALGMIFILAGGVVLSWGGGFALNSLAGPGLIFLACLCWAIDNNFTRKISGKHPVQLVTLKSLVAGGTNVALALSLGAVWPQLGTVLATATIGLLGYGLSLVCFVLALRHIGAARTGAYFSLAPFVGSVLAVLFLRDSVTANLGVAALFMALGVWLHLTESHSHFHDHEELEHSHDHSHDEHHDHEHDGERAANAEKRTHTHPHRHKKIGHAHAHFPDFHHQHRH
jgi:drug/metabolite transporter (DMT)-like permease